MLYYIWRGTVLDLTTWNWIVNTNDMICRNPEHGITVKMELKGEKFRGKLHDMPMEFFAEISKYADGEKIIQSIVKAAEEEYIKKPAG